MQWPDDEVFALIGEDLQPLFAMFPDGVLSLPDDVFAEAEIATLSNGTLHATPWEFTATAAVRRRGDPVDPRTFTVRGVTVAELGVEPPVFRRYVDWAEVWAQLGMSSGRGESDSRSRTNRFNSLEARDQFFLDPAGEDITDQQLLPPS